MVAECAECADVVLLGEFHDDAVAHFVEYAVYKLLVQHRIPVLGVGNSGMHLRYLPAKPCKYFSKHDLRKVP